MISAENNESLRHVAIVTSTRADWGLLSPVAKALREREGVRVSVIATNMHLDPLRGMTVGEIEADGFEPAFKVEMNSVSDSPSDTVMAMSRCMAGMAEAFETLRPDLLLILGDRYEMLAVASAATLFGIPIAHISGGEITEGAFDDNIRHALSKLSSLHFATTENHRKRLIAMGEQPETVFNAGALGVSNILNEKLLDREALEASTGFTIDRSTLLVTYHPATNDPADPTERFAALLAALDRFPELKVLFTYPNNDPRGQRLIAMIEEYAAANSGRVKAIPSLGRRRYLSALQFVGAVVGNSSSGIVEVPSAGIPTVDIGIRQRGRTAAASVIHCGDGPDAIVDAIAKAVSPEFREIASRCGNPYYKENTVGTIADKLCDCDINSLLPKKFYDIKPLS